MTPGSQRELVLEQRHLLGVFFAVVLLGALSFAAGFILGRNRGETEAAARYASVSAALPQSGDEQEKKNDGKPNASDLTFFDTVGQKKPADVPPAPKPKRTPKPPAPKPAAALTKPIFLQVGAFAEEPQARKLVERLGTLGFTARVIPPETDKLYRVRVGPYNREDLADAARRRLEANGFRPLRR